MTAITAHIVVRDAARAADRYRVALGGTEHGRTEVEVAAAGRTMFGG